jgi:hypothetical protein
VLSPSWQSSSPSIAPPPPFPNDEPSSSLSSPPSLSQSSDQLGDDLWQCSLGCGQRYEISSSRSIRRHMMSCFRSHWPDGDKLSDDELQALMSAEQESGHLVTGLRRWKMRQTARSTMELIDAERWTCPYRCNQVYRVSSSRSIQEHLLRCKERPHDQQPEGGDDGSAASVPAPSTPVVAGDGRTRATEGKVNQALTMEEYTFQVDALQDDAELVQEKDDSGEILRYENSSDDLSCPRTVPSSHPVSTSGCEDTPLRILQQRQQLEAEHLSARHMMEVVALCEDSEMAIRNPDSALPHQAYFSFLPAPELRRPAG